MKNLTNSQIHIGDIHIDPTRNHSRQSTHCMGMFAKSVTKEGKTVYDYHEVIYSLVDSNGIDQVRGSLPVLIPLTDEEAKAYAKAREAELDQLNKAKDADDQIKCPDPSAPKVSISKADRVELFKELYCTKQGKIRAPKWRAGAGFRRLFAYTDALIVSRKLERPIPLEIPLLTAPQGLSLEDEIMINIKENEGAKKAKLETSNVQKVKSAKALMDVQRETSPGASPVALLERQCGYKHGMAGKLAGIALADYKFPECGFVDAIESGAINFGKIEQSSAYKKAKELASREDLAGWMDDLVKKTAEGNAPGIMTKDGILALKEYKVDFLTLVVEAIETKDTAQLVLFKRNAEAVNAAFAKVAELAK